MYCWLLLQIQRLKTVLCSRVTDCTNYFELIHRFFFNENIDLSQKLTISSQFNTVQSLLHEKTDTMVLNQNDLFK